MPTPKDTVAVEAHTVIQAGRAWKKLRRLTDKALKGPLTLRENHWLQRMLDAAERRAS